MHQERHNSAKKFHFQQLKHISILLFKVWCTLNSMFKIKEHTNALHWSKRSVAYREFQNYLLSPHMISVWDVWCGLLSVYEFLQKICSKLSQVLKLQQSSYYMIVKHSEKGHTVFLYTTSLSFFYKSWTNTRSQIMVDSSYSNFHATFLDLCYQTNISMSLTLWETDVVLDEPSEKKRIPGFKPIRDKTQRFNSFKTPHRMLTDSHNSFMTAINTGN